MPTFRLRMTDGEEVVVTTTMRDAVAAERAVGKTAGPVETGMWAAWHRLKPGVPFEEWADRVDTAMPDEPREPGPTPGG